MTKAFSAGLVAALLSAFPQDRPAQTPPTVRDRTFEFLFKMGPTQLAHSKLHGFLYTFEHPLQTLQSVWIQSSVTNSETTPVLSPPATVVNEIACRVDSVFVGSVIETATYPIVDGTFLFTDYEVKAVEVLKSPRRAQLAPGRNTTVSRLGGSLTIDGTVVSTGTDWLPMLEKGATYLFFVQFIPETADFISGPKSPTASVARLEKGRWFFLDGPISSAGNLRDVGVDRSLVTSALVQDCRSSLQ